MNRSRSFVTDLRVVMRGGDFRRLFGVRLTSQASDGAFQVALTSLFFFSPERATTPAAVAGAFAAAVLPYTLIGPFAGVLLDIWPRRQVLLVANAVRSLMVLGVAGLVAAGVVGVPLYVAALACLSVNRFFLAGLGASLPHVVPRHELVMANAVSPTCGALAAMLGAAMGFGVRTLLGAGDGTDALVLVVAAAGYATSAALASRMPRHLLGPDHIAPRLAAADTSRVTVPDLSRGAPPEAELETSVASPTTRERTSALVRGVVGDIARGAGHVRDRPDAAHALAAIGVHRIGFGLATLATVLLCRNRLTDPTDVDAGLALLASVFGASGAGFAVAALVTPVAVARVGEHRWIVWCCGASAVLQLVLAFALGRTTLVLAAFVFGVGAQGAKICVDSIVQACVDDAFRGRVFSFYDVVFNAAFVTAAALGAALLPTDGYSRSAFVGIAALYALTAFGYGRASRAAVRQGSTE